MKTNDTTKTFHRSLSDAFPDERANSITCYRRPLVRRPIVRSLLILAAIVLLIVWLLLVLAPK